LLDNSEIDLEHTHVSSKFTTNMAGGLILLVCI
jgi:hypothetical protein